MVLIQCICSVQTWPPQAYGIQRLYADVLTALIGEDPVRLSVSTPRPATANPDIRFNRDILHCPTWPENGSTNHRCEVCEKRYKLDVKQNPNIPYKDRKYKSVKTSVYCDHAAFTCV